MVIHDSQFLSPVEARLAKRLASLSAMPIDMSAFEARMKKLIPPPGKTTHHWTRSLIALAASLILIVSISLPFMSPSTVQASPVQMAQMHEDLVAGKIPTVETASSDEANRLLAIFNNNGLRMPQVKLTHDMRCSMQTMEERPMAMMLFEEHGKPVTLGVAKAKDFRLNSKSIIQRSGHTYEVQKVGELNMVMAVRGDHFICLTSALATDQLIELAESLQF